MHAQDLMDTPASYKNRNFEIAHGSDHKEPHNVCTPSLILVHANTTHRANKTGFFLKFPMKCLELTTQCTPLLILE